MDAATVLDSENCVALARDDKTKGMVKGSKIGSAPRKRLADISNLQQRPRPVDQEVKKLPVSLTTKEYIEKLQRENLTLMKILADRNKTIELSGMELQKLRLNLQKVQQQNLQLAQANSQMLATVFDALVKLTCFASLQELNSGKDRLKALYHELGCKNGLLKARKLEKVKEKMLICQDKGNKVGLTECDEAAQAGESSQADKGDCKPCNTNRRRQSKKQSLGPTTTKPVHAKENVEKKRCLRRQSSRFNSEEPEPTEDLFEIDKASGPTSLKPVHAEENVGNKRRCLRRQSARFKSIEPEQTEDLFEIDSAKFPVSPVHDDLVHESGQMLSGLSVKEEDEGNTALRFEAQENRRSSVGRPLRRAAEKVQSYKEIPLNIKMRRNE
uniref:Shugoshin C-terminal domain-containing protein n=1 Tax=Quercus lobata TaxID=97700 RepID=A0A7N2MD82_QUELO